MGPSSGPAQTSRHCRRQAQGESRVVVNIGRRMLESEQTRGTASSAHAASAGVALERLEPEHERANACRPRVRALYALARAARTRRESVRRRLRDVVASPLERLASLAPRWHRHRSAPSSRASSTMRAPARCASPSSRSRTPSACAPSPSAWKQRQQVDFLSEHRLRCSAGPVFLWRQPIVALLPSTRMPTACYADR